MPYLPGYWVISIVLQLLSLVTATPARIRSNQRTPLVRTRNGSLAGVYSPSFDQDFFLGVPYASAPVGGLRFNRPAPSEAWNGTKKATSYGPWCVGRSIGLAGFSQNITAKMSEDCLHLNIVRPAGTTQNDKLPILVWIHGGAWDEGSAADQRYNGSFIVQNSVRMDTAVMFISFNYRLGVFGMLAGSVPEQAGLTNLVLHDQRQALAWIQENIAYFGGDASRVTLMGESAGAINIGHHLVAYGGRNDGLFSAAIAQSGGLFSTVPPFRNTTQREADFRLILNATGCAGTIDSLACLRNAPTKLIRNASRYVPRFFTIDGDILPESNLRLLQEGRFIRVPLLIGSNRNEGTSFTQSFLSQPLSSNRDFAAYVTTFWGGRVLTDKVIDSWERLYQDEIDNPSGAGLGTVLPNPGPRFGSEYGKATLWTGDVMFTAGRRFANRLWAQHGIPSYSYWFDTVTANVDGVTLGAAHYQEIPFVFGNKNAVGWQVNPFPADPGMKRKYNKLADVMSQMWISFAVKRSPNFHKVPDVDVVWPVYTEECPTNMVFSARTGGHLQPDTWRTDAINLIIKQAS